MCFLIHAKKISFFYNQKNLYTLHGHVFVMGDKKVQVKISIDLVSTDVME